MNLEHIAALAKMANVPDERIQAHTSETEPGFAGISIEDLTPSEMRTLVMAIISIEPYAVDRISLDTPGAVTEGDDTITLRYGDTNPDAF